MPIFDSITSIPKKIGKKISTFVNKIKRVFGLFAPNPDTRSVVILGMKAAGKTTLWYNLMKRTDGKLNTQVEKIDSFYITAGGRTVKVESTKDIGGSDDFIKQGLWDKLIEKDSFVYFLIDLNDVDKKEIRKRLYKIKDIKTKKGIVEDRFGIKIVGTHYDMYSEGKSVETAKWDLLKKLDYKETDYWSDNILIVNLLETKDVDKIKDEIVNPKFTSIVR